MNSRELGTVEKANRSLISEAGLPHALLYLTATGMRKNILDATLPLRTLFSESGYHDYSKQVQGRAGKTVKTTRLLLDDCCVETSVSMYRPDTKQGDPRLWLYKLGVHAKPDDVLALFVVDGVLHCINLTSSRLVELQREGVRTASLDYISELKKANSSVADELLEKLRAISRAGPIPATCAGPTAVGRAVESALGIQLNSDRAPDYRGIELKAGRIPVAGKGTRQTLFACVPCWSISALKSSQALLDHFGYDRAGVRKLYCTVSTRTPNSQGLQLRLLPAIGTLSERGPAPFAQGAVAWELDTLHERLRRKHNETFWIKARSSEQNGREFFQLTKVTHTRSPSCVQFDELIENGEITVDHLIKRAAGRTREKGPLFKVTRKSLATLFLAEPRAYDL